MNFIENQNWRYATKEFNTGRKVSSENLTLLKQAIQLSVSSYGLQPYEVLIIEVSAVRNKLKSASWNQSQITEASHLFVFCNYTELKPTHVDEFIRNTAEIRKQELSEVKGYGDFIKSTFAKKTVEGHFQWARNQTYLALANLLAACAELRIDACPMEGFEPEKYNQILGLRRKGLNASLVAAVGYRSDLDATQHQAKVRKAESDLFVHIWQEKV